MESCISITERCDGCLDDLSARQVAELAVEVRDDRRRRQGGGGGLRGERPALEHFPFSSTHVPSSRGATPDLIRGSKDDRSGRRNEPVQPAVSTGSAAARFGRYPPKSGPIMLTLSFVAIDPSRNLPRATAQPASLLFACEFGVLHRGRIEPHHLNHRASGDQNCHRNVGIDCSDSEVLTVGFDHDVIPKQ